MAATGTPTPNIGLRRAQGTDPASVDDINYNSALIDTKLGAVGNSSVQDQIDTLNSKITSLITTESKTQAITWASTSNAYYEGYTDIAKTGYTPIGIIGYEVTGSLASAVVVSAIEVGSNNRAWIAARMISFTPSSTTGNGIIFTVLYRKND